MVYILPSIENFRRRIPVFLAFFVLLGSVTVVDSVAQSFNCTAATPTFTVNLTGSPMAVGQAHLQCAMDPAARLL